MNRNRNIRLMTAAALALLLTACTADTNMPAGSDVPAGSGEELRVTLSLTPEVPLKVDTRTVNQPTEAMDEVFSLLVIQYNMQGDIVKRMTYNWGDFTTTTNGYTIKDCYLSNEPGKIYVIANEGQVIAMNGEIQQEENMPKIWPVNAEHELSINGNYLMSGVYAGTPTPYMNIPLKRAVAQLVLYVDVQKILLPPGDDFQFISMQLKQVPNVMGFHDGGVALPYPAASGQFIDFEPVTGAEYSNQNVYFFLPENLRGTGSATIQEMKNENTAPAGQGKYCTYIEVKGMYTIANKSPENVTYRIYLGGNNTNDYNVKRNTIYRVFFGIKGIDRTDTRITVENAPSTEGYLDYTDNATAWFGIQNSIKKDQKGSDLMTGIPRRGSDGSICDEGWRIPKEDELLLMYVYNGLLISPDEIYEIIYWGAETDMVRQTRFCCTMWYPSSIGKDESGYAGYARSEIEINLRCIKDL